MYLEEAPRTGTAVALQDTVCLRFWRHMASRTSAIELRRRYLVSRQQFNTRRELLTVWRMHAAASQHAAGGAAEKVTGGGLWR